MHAGQQGIEGVKGVRGRDGTRARLRLGGKTDPSPAPSSDVEWAPKGVGSRCAPGTAAPTGRSVVAVATPTWSLPAPDPLRAPPTAACGPGCDTQPTSSACRGGPPPSEPPPAGTPTGTGRITCGARSGLVLNRVPV